MLPSAVDWASAGAVSPVKDQGTCGSCWSFAATGAIEASLYVDRGVSTSLSEEQLIDCDKGAPQDGCKGGAIEEAFRWVRAAAAQFGAIRRNSLTACSPSTSHTFRYFWSYWLSVGYPQWAAGYKKYLETWKAQAAAATAAWQEQAKKISATLPAAPAYPYPYYYPFWPFVAPTTATKPTTETAAAATTTTTTAADQTAAGTTNLIEAKKEEPKAAAPATEAKKEEAKKEEAPVEAKKEEVKL